MMGVVVQRRRKRLRDSMAAGMGDEADSETGSGPDSQWSTLVLVDGDEADRPKHLLNKQERNSLATDATFKPVEAWNMTTVTA